MSVNDMKRFQNDLFSTEAEDFMKIITPHLPYTDSAKTLREWDLKYNADSIGAVIFEKIKSNLLREVFGKRCVLCNYIPPNNFRRRS